MNDGGVRGDKRKVCSTRLLITSTENRTPDFVILRPIRYLLDHVPQLCVFHVCLYKTQHMYRSFSLLNRFGRYHGKNANESD